MSKKIRVGWDDLKPGDLIHVKGSTNTYKFVSYGSETISGDPEKVTPKKAKQYAFVDIQATVGANHQSLCQRPYSAIQRL